MPLASAGSERGATNGRRSSVGRAPDENCPRELRCLVCQNETLADSRADWQSIFASQIREQMKAGKSDKEIVVYLTDRYGKFILYNPPVDPTTYLLWFGPFLFLLLGLAFLFRYLKQRPRIDHGATSLSRRAQPRGNTSQNSTGKTNSMIVFWADMRRSGCHRPGVYSPDSARARSYNHERKREEKKPTSTSIEISFPSWMPTCAMESSVRNNTNRIEMR
jgi:cytochrome c-type biogenesis protein CcmH/NrfF